jgi:hypothetical protein
MARKVAVVQVVLGGQVAVQVVLVVVFCQVVLLQVVKVMQEVVTLDRVE